MTPKVSIQIQDLDGSSFPRVYSPLDWLARRGDIELVTRWNMFDADAVVFQRHWKPDTLHILHSLKKHGIRVVVDADDNYFSIPASNENKSQYQDAAVRTSLPRILAAADILTVSTRRLARQYRDFNSNIHILPNTLDIESRWNFENLDQIRAESKVKESRLVVGWSGSPSHAGDFTFLRGFWKKLHAQYGEKLVFRFFGYLPEMLKQEFPDPAVYNRMVSYQPFVPFEEYSASLAWMAADIALAPLVKNDFNQCRSNLKWLEYSAAGAAVIASELDPYIDTWTVRTPNRCSDWVECVEDLIRNPHVRQEFIDHSRRRIRESYMVERAALIYRDQVLAGLAPRTAFSLPGPAQPVDCDRIEVDVVIPIYNAPVETFACLEAAYEQVRFTPGSRLVAIDDASDNPIGNLDDYHGFRNETNLGFVGTCNRAAFELTRPDADIILLNSDTVPSPGFIEQLRRTAYSDSRIGTVTAVSNHGSIASVPPVSDVSSLLKGRSFEPIAAPTAVGHCMYIKREVIRKYGLFSTDFGKGYGEENDFSMRIAGEYWNVIDPNCYVWHKGNASFGTSVNQDSLVTKKHPGYPFEVVNFQHGDPLQTVRRHILDRTQDPRPRILNVVHSYMVEAGTEKHVLDLSRALGDDFLIFTAVPNQPECTLDLYWDKEKYGSKVYYSPDWPITKTETPGYQKAWKEILEEIRPDIVHVHHLLNHPLGLMKLLTDSGIPIVVSIHDAYLICPDPQLYLCPGVNKCQSCFVNHFNGGTPEYPEDRRAILHTELIKTASIIAPSLFIAGKIQEVWPDLEIAIIPHGIPLAEFRNQPRNETVGKLRFGFIGNLTERKGLPILLAGFRQFRATAAGKDTELHLFGNSNLTHIDSPGIIYHGGYRNEDLPKLLVEFDIGIIPSAYAESYCYTLDELLAGGVPVLSVNHGAPAERITEGRNGWLFEPNDPGSLRDKLAAVATAWRSGIRLQPGPENSTLRSTQEMAFDYTDLYRKIIVNKPLTVDKLTIGS